MSNHASTNSSDAASATTSQMATSPFSPHASAFGPNISLGVSNRIHGIASDGQSHSSRASSFASGHDHSVVSAQKGFAGTSHLATSPLGNAELTPPSFGQFNFGDRIRSSDHSRNNSSGAMSNLSVSSSALHAGSSTQRAHSPLPQHLVGSGRNSFAIASTDSLGQSQSSGFNARSPSSLIASSIGEELQRRLSSSYAIRNESPSLAPPGASGHGSGSRPPFGRQSFSDGPSSSATNLLSADLSSAAMEARHGSFSGSYSSADNANALPSNASPMTAGLSNDPYDPTGTGAPAAPSTGPLSASDPRTQLLVSNLPYRVRWQDLKDLFRKAGTVLRADVSLSADNRSRGYGTVLMATEQDAIKAADMLGGFTWQGRTLDVRVDRSGSLVGVAGSAVMPIIANNGTGPSSGGFAGSDQGFNNQQYLGVPPGFNSQGHSPGGASPSALSPLARAADSSLPSSTRASFSAYSDMGQGGSEFERAMLQGQNYSGSGTPNRSRQGTGYDSGFGGQGQGQHRSVSAVQALNSSQAGSRRGSEVGVGMGAAMPSAGVWGNGGNDATSLYSQNTGGSSVPTGFPGATAMAPWPQGPGALGGNPSMQSQPFNSQMPTTSYAGRVLFVGNLPFHCQWQDLKDLFRAAGNIQRADVAIGPDGRSRGFGTVLFASQEDAQNAVRLYHGYEYSGRTLKVHFDRFAAQNGPAIGTPGNPAQYTGAFAAAALPSHMTNNVRAPVLPPVPGQPMQQYPRQLSQHQRGGAAMPFVPQQQQAGQPSFGQTAYQTLNQQQLQLGQQYPAQLQSQQQRYGQQQQQQVAAGFSAFADAGRGMQGQSAQQSFSMFGGIDDARQNNEGFASDRRGSAAKSFGLFTDSNDAADENAPGRDDDYGMSITLPANGFGAASSYLPSDLMSPGLTSPPVPTNSHPGRIQLPSNNNFANSFGAAADQMTPMTARMQVPMTPGMPGFTFHQVPQTPPMHPHFLSPDVGPLSPDADDNTQTAGSTMAQQNAGYVNAAPGAPVHGGAAAGFNPMFPTTSAYGGGAQDMPATPHWSQPSGPRRGGAVRQSGGDAPHNPEADEVVDEARSNIAKTPGARPRRPSLARRASDGTPGAIEPSDGYPFPLVAGGNVAHLARRKSTNPPAQTPLAGPGRHSNKSSGPATTAVPAGELLAGTSAEDLANTIARLSVKGTALAKERSMSAATGPKEESLGAPLNIAGRGKDPVERLLGMKMSNSVLEAARNESALETGSDAGGSGSRKSTPGEELAAGK